jgi:hypothetical protein
MNSSEQTLLLQLHADAMANYKAGCRSAESILPAPSLAMLRPLGISPQFLYDCVDDLSRYGEPSLDTFLELAAMRMDHFRDVLGGKSAPREVQESDLPPKSAAFDGVDWLPRIIRKAQCFLEGSLCPEIMYGCGGDRAFLREYKIPLPAFLAEIQKNNGDPGATLRFLRSGVADSR